MSKAEVAVSTHSVAELEAMLEAFDFKLPLQSHKSAAAQFLHHAPCGDCQLSVHHAGGSLVAIRAPTTKWSLQMVLLLCSRFATATLLMRSRRRCCGTNGARLWLHTLHDCRQPQSTLLHAILGTSPPLQARISAHVRQKGFSRACTALPRRDSGGHFTSTAVDGTPCCLLTWVDGTPADKV